jgi:small subunit ribosomal protein S10e
MHGFANSLRFSVGPALLALTRPLFVLLSTGRRGPDSKLDSVLCLRLSRRNAALCFSSCYHRRLARIALTCRCCAFIVPIFRFSSQIKQSLKMFMPKKERIAIYSYLFKEGVITCQKDPRLAKHHILDMPNIHALDALRSLKSRGYVREIFNWQWFYYFLTDEGIAYLRNYLYLDENVVPATLKKPVGKQSGEFWSLAFLHLLVAI